MNRLLSKLHTLLLPRVELEGVSLPPLPAEVRAAADLMRWLAGELPASRLLFLDEMLAQHRRWPNVNDWQGFQRAVEQLTAPAEAAGGAELMAFDEARQLLLAEARLMAEVAPGAAAPAKARSGLFLPTDSQRRVFRELVLTYHRDYIEGKGLKHKEQMLHWAAVYQAVAEWTGLRGAAFCGPEFDAFVYDYCGIAYNASSSRRGRYRSVQDLLARCLDVGQTCPQRDDFNRFRSAMVRLINGQQRIVSRTGSDVPTPLNR